eukprot:CAMPEP_0185188542 /NCGR_PEP_ID=MMETSP1140-20130426/5472_1 /TAXON_ID=298111 /ORGANISM="Pavlova sp., Strain CCMP459" /LENGTH=247 /DNA_ID=CAMNT_0027755051 /DNA_START=1 /DNA_END=744 /DNA_ORIENTATION=+
MCPESVAPLATLTLARLWSPRSNLSYPAACSRWHRGASGASSPSSSSPSRPSSPAGRAFVPPWALCVVSGVTRECGGALYPLFLATVSGHLEPLSSSCRPLVRAWDRGACGDDTVVGRRRIASAAVSSATVYALRVYGGCGPWLIKQGYYYSFAVRAVCRYVARRRVRSRPWLDSLYLTGKLEGSRTCWDSGSNPRLSHTNTESPPTGRSGGLEPSKLRGSGARAAAHPNGRPPARRAGMDIAPSRG